MVKKKGKDKSSREEDEIDLAGKEYIINECVTILMIYDNL